MTPPPPPPRPFKNEYPTFCSRCDKEVSAGKIKYSILIREVSVNRDNGVKIKMFIDLCPVCFGGFEKWMTDKIMKKIKHKQQS